MVGLSSRHACQRAAFVFEDLVSSVPSSSAAVIANQVFIGLPWKTVRAKYEKIIDKLRTQYPISFVIVGRDDSQDAEDLLEVIKEKIDSSSYAIFDATDGNANVSLEYGYAEAGDIDRALYLSARKTTASKLEHPIISDLAGKRRNQYKTEKKLKALLVQFCDQHSFTKRFENCLRKSFRRKTKGEKRRLRSLALKIVHTLDGVKKRRREDVVNDLLADVSAYKRSEIDDVLRDLRHEEMISIPQGRYSTISLR